MVMHKVSATPREAGAVQAMLLMLAALLPIMGTLTMLPVMPLLFSHFAAQPHAQLLVPMIITIPAASMALLAPLAGMVGDRLSRRRLLIAATALYAGFGLLPVMLDDLYAILLARLVMGIADAFILTTANALIGDYFAGEARSKWLAVQSGIGSILSTLIVLGAGLLGTRAGMARSTCMRWRSRSLSACACSPQSRRRAVAWTVSLAKRLSLFHGAKWRRSA